MALRIVLIFFALLLAHPAAMLARCPAAPAARAGQQLPRNSSHRHSWDGIRQRVRHFINPDDSYTDISPTTLSVVSAAFGAAGLIALALTVTPAFLVAVFVGGIAATIAGAIGLKRHRRGLAIIGMALGLLEIVGGLIVLALLV